MRSGGEGVIVREEMGIMTALGGGGAVDQEDLHHIINGGTGR